MTPQQHLVVRHIAAVVLSAIALMSAAVTLAFLAVHVSAGDPVTAILGESSDPALRAQVERDWGLDRPLVEQYLSYLGRLVHGDLGYSYVRGEPVAQILFGEQLTTSAQLAGFVLVATAVLAPTLAVLTAGRRHVLARLLGTVELALASAPTFWIGLILIAVFAFGLRILPVTSGNELQRLILPGLTLTLPISAVLSQVIREGIERALEQPHALTARARGTGEIGIRLKHGLRHAMIPAATLAGWAVSSLITGTVVVEEVFGRAGIGRATVEAVTYKDLPVVLAVALFAAAIYLTVSVLVDIAYLWIDPRLREVTR